MSPFVRLELMKHCVVVRLPLQEAVGVTGATADAINPIGDNRRGLEDRTLWERHDARYEIWRGRTG